MRSTQLLTSAAAPFDGAPTRTDWLLAALLAQASTSSQWSAAGELCSAMGPGQGTLFPADWVRPAIYAWVGSDILLVSFTGTNALWQWVGQVLGSAQAPQPRIPGQVSVFWGAIGIACWAGIVPFLNDHLGGRTLVFVGHSLGGALAQVAGSLANIYDWPIGGIYCLGAPRVGNQAFADSIGAFTWRLEDTLDPIVALPPELWAGVGSNFPLPGPGPFATYVHAGVASTMDPYGQLVQGSNPTDLGQVVLQAVAQSAPTHLSSEYARRLRAQWIGPEYQDPGALGYQDPSKLGDFFVVNLPTSRAQYQQQLCKLGC